MVQENTQLVAIYNQLHNAIGGVFTPRLSSFSHIIGVAKSRFS